MGRKARKVRKTGRPTQAKGDRARSIPGTEAQTKTIEEAVDLSAFRKEAIRGVRRLAGSHSVRDVLQDGVA